MWMGTPSDEQGGSYGHRAAHPNGLPSSYGKAKAGERYAAEAELADKGIGKPTAVSGLAVRRRR